MIIYNDFMDVIILWSIIQYINVLSNSNVNVQRKRLI